MRTLSECTGNGNPTATSQQREETKAQLDNVLQQFDVLPSRFDRVLFQYIYVYLLVLFVPAQVLSIIYFLGRNPQVMGALLQVGLGVPSLVIFILGIWRFNVWRVRTPNTLRDLWENKRIALPDGDAGTSYLRFLDRYHDALASPKRYFLSGLLMILTGILFAYAIEQTLSSEGPTIQIVVYLLFVFLDLGGFYCIGILTWVMVISSGYVRKLVQAF